MANQKVCAVADCSKRFYCRGFCTSHYQQYMKYGDPLGRHISPLKTFIEHALKYEGDDCLIWPHGKATAGYGMARYNGETNTAHVLICKLAHGPKSHSKLEVRHTCGVRACVNPRHLVWGTRKQNMHDKIAHGTAPRGAKNGHTKLTEANVRWIRQSGSDRPRKEIAAMFGVTEQNIGKIIHRKHWDWLE